MTVTLSLKVHETQSLFPLCVCLGRLDPNREATGVGIVPLISCFQFLTLNKFLIV